VPACRIVIAVLFGCMLVPAAARAHAILMQSTPAAGASVPAGRLDMSFRYNSRIDRIRSRLVLTGPDRRESVLRIAPSGPPELIETSAELSAPGAYVVRWQVLAIDGHITRGDVPFTVPGH
jgi:methionine-rich copper-binding protein CopC